MDRVLIFAGGKGARMKINGDVPKQFLEISGKPIIIHTLEKFEKNRNVDDIVVVCIAPWIEELNKQIKKFGITKVSKVIAGGETGFESRMIGLQHMYDTKNNDNDIILIHDGVRPLITDELITNNINTAKRNGNAITVAKVTETVVYKRTKASDEFLDRDYCVFARAPQTFRLGRIYELYKQAQKEGREDIIDSASLAYFYGDELYYVECPQENIKVTTPIDYYSVKGIIESQNEKTLGD